MDEHEDYTGEVEIIHLLTFIKRHFDWDYVRKRIKVPLTKLKVAPYYGCTLHRPQSVGIEPPGRYDIMIHLLKSLGINVINFSDADFCCGSYQIVSDPKSAIKACNKIIARAQMLGAEALVISCPLCEYNLIKSQNLLIKEGLLQKPLAFYYFTTLLAIALGLDYSSYNFLGKHNRSIKLLQEHKYIK
jgi:heterodisulfide reductase subunit B